MQGEFAHIVDSLRDSWFFIGAWLPRVLTALSFCC
jgi:hypothetical protein